MRDDLVVHGEDTQGDRIDRFAKRQRFGMPEKTTFEGYKNHHVHKNMYLQKQGGQEANIDCLYLISGTTTCVLKALIQALLSMGSSFSAFNLLIVESSWPSLPSTSMVKESAEVSASSLMVGIPGMEGVAAAEEEWFSIVGVWPLAPSPTPIMGGPSKYGLTFANLETKIQTLPEIKIALLKILHQN